LRLPKARLKKAIKLKQEARHWKKTAASAEAYRRDRTAHQCQRSNDDGLPARHGDVAPHQDRWQPDHYRATR
jgi:hypothetical protein